MVLAKIKGRLSQADASASLELTPQLSAAGLIVRAAHPGGPLTEIERQAAAASLMKLFHVPGPRAAELRTAGERLENSTLELAQTAGTMDPDDRGQLVGLLWAYPGADALMDDVAEGFGVPRERVDALRPRPAIVDDAKTEATGP